MRPFRAHTVSLGERVSSRGSEMAVEKMGPGDITSYRSRGGSGDCRTAKAVE
jgi:hypothetical protein